MALKALEGAAISQSIRLAASAELPNAAGAASVLTDGVAMRAYRGGLVQTSRPLLVVAGLDTYQLISSAIS